MSNGVGGVGGARAAQSLTNATADGTTDGAGELLPEPATPGVGTELLMELLLRSAGDAKRAHRDGRQAAAEERQTQQKVEVDKMRDEAADAFGNALVSGALKIGAGAVKYESAEASLKADQLNASAPTAENGTKDLSAYATAKDGATKLELGATLIGAESDFAKACGDEDVKNLQADQKQAAGRATTAKEAYDNENDGLRSEKDLQDAILRAFDALSGLKAQNARSFLTPETRG